MPTLLRQSRYKPMLPFVPPAMLTPGSDDTQSLAVNPRFSDALAGVNDTDQDWRGGSQDNTPPVPPVEAKQSSMPPPGVGSTPNQAPRPTGPPGVQQAAVAAPAPAPAAMGPPQAVPSSAPPSPDEQRTQDIAEMQAIPPEPAAPAAPEEDLDAQRKAALKKTQDLSTPTPYTSNWAQRLSMALLAGTKLASVANMIVHPKWSEQERNRQAQLGAAEGQLKDIETAASGAALEAQRTETAERNRLQGENYTATQAERQRKTEEDERAKKLTQNEKLEQGMLKPWGEDAQLQKEGDPVPQGMETTQSLTQPGMVWVHPPAMVPLTEDMAMYAPGRKVGDLMPYGEFKKAQAQAADAAKGVAIAGAKTPANTPLDQQYVNEYLRLHPGSTVADAVKAHARDAQAPQREPQPPQALMIGPDGKAMVVRPGTTVAPGSQTPAGVNSVSTPTMQMRNVAAQAGLVHDQTPMMLSEIDRLKGKLGPMAGRWNEVMQGKVGMNDPDFAGLRADLLMYSSAVALMHARGRLPENLRAEFDHTINNPSQDFENLKAIIKRIDDWTVKNQNAMGAGGRGAGGATGGGADPLGIR